jgi:aspartyl-tRNA(Asn)/glutamyl-tRNA(Gln) amidotransferase subunit A
MNEIHALSASELVALYTKGELSPVDVAHACFRRIESWEPQINAMYLVKREEALAQARAAEARWRAAAPLSPIDGVPITIKENIYTKGDPAPLGCAANASAQAKQEDAPAAARVREAGCVILGKTTMPDYAMLASGVSSFHGVTRNPWKLDRNTSGSSGGAAAAAAARYAPLHLGTDIGGSVRLPATHCGVFALKPSQGRVPVYPPFMGRVVGPITRTVEDAAGLLGVLTQPDARDFTGLPSKSAKYIGAPRSEDSSWVKSLRIGLLHNTRAGLTTDPEIRDAVQQAGTALEGEGAKLDELKPFLTQEMLDGLFQFFEARSYNDFAQLSREEQAKVLPHVAQWCTRRAPEFTGRQLMQAYLRIMEMRQAAVAACGQYDFVISPTSPILSFAAEAASPSTDPENPLPISYTVPYNMSEQPAAALNWRFSDGLPVGLQVIGRRFDDEGVLRLARILERIRPGQKEWPEPAVP